jgi:hypothetical protein
MDAEPSSLLSRQSLEDLVQLGFLCGQGLGRSGIATRYLQAIAALAPADSAWLVQDGGVLARHGSGEPPAQRPRPAGMGVAQSADGILVAGVLPGLELVLSPQPGNATRHREVCMLGARLLGVALLAEEGPPGLFVDDYQQAKRTFKKLWLQSLLARHGAVGKAARAAGLNRATIYAMLGDGQVSGKPDMADAGDG